MLKVCELCERPARMYCESDEASLCWACDSRVHGANFLAARHSRWLLCRRCQGPTPWRAEGARLVPTFFVCERCCGEAKMMEREEEEEDESDDDGGDDVEEQDEEEDGDNQVVPWALTPKQMRENADLAASEDNRNSSSSGPSILTAAEDDATSSGGEYSATLPKIAGDPATTPGPAPASY